MKMRKLLTAACTFLCIILLVGCGENKELADYEKNIETFITALNEKDAEIDAIDPTTENAINDLLEKLETLQTTFEEFAAVTAPEQLADVQITAVDASDTMTEAVNLFRQAFEGEDFDKETYDIALQSYNHAFARLEDISNAFAALEAGDSVDKNASEPNDENSEDNKSTDETEKSENDENTENTNDTENNENDNQEDNTSSNDEAAAPAEDEISTDDIEAYMNNQSGEDSSEE